MTTLIAGSVPVVDRFIERVLGKRSVSAVSLASVADEAMLARLPSAARCESQEADVSVLERLHDALWERAIQRAARAEGVEAETLERLVSQMFVLSWGRKLGVIRLCLAVMDAPLIRLASDLPPVLRRAFLAECGGRVVPAPFLSGILRFVRTVQDVGGLLARHVLRMVRLSRLGGLGPKAARSSSYVAWLGATDWDVANAGPDRFSLTEFLAEARSRTSIDEVMIQGSTPPARLPEGMRHRGTVPPLRYRPPLLALTRALLDQARLAFADLMWAFDFRRRTLVSRAIIDLPAFRLWFTVDRPAAVLYSNATIGSEPPVALLGPRYDVPSMMAFYSANVCYRHPPAQLAGCSAHLEPEQRFIVADRLTMWSETMTDAFGSAGYSRARLVETGPVVFARQAAFRPTSCYLGVAEGPVRIGIFDVSVLLPRRRFDLGEGQLIYNPDYTMRFFGDIFEAARGTFSEEFVVVRKLKRSLNPYHMEDIDFSRLPPATILSRDPAESLWRTLEAVDIVLCMPFTSVAYLAEIFGLPAAFYDPSGTVSPSPLGGRAPLLSGRAALDAWLAAPIRFAAHDPDELIGPRVLAAATGGVLAVRAGKSDNHQPERLETYALHT